MKTKLFTLLLAVAASIGTIFAESGTCGENLTWDLTNGVLTISGAGAMNDYDWNYTYTTLNTPWYSIRSSIKSVVISNGVTSIGDYAFAGCSKLTSVTIGNSVTSIGDGAFENCTSLHTVTIPNSVTSIGGSVFYGCSGLTSPAYNTHVFAFLPTTYSGAYTIPDGVEIIAGGAFSECTGLTSINIPNSVTSIGEWAFSDCTGLTSVTIPNSVTSIGEYAFSGCTNLTSVEIPNSVTSIGGAPFYQCRNLTSITVSADNPNYISEDGVLFDKGKKTLIQYPVGNTRSSYIIPNTVTSIGNNAFSNCISLGSVTIPNNVTSIGSNAFSGCKNITSVTWNAVNCNSYNFGSQVTSFTFGNEVEHIPAYLCNGMSNLTSIEIPNSVTSIGEYAFERCSGLISVTIPNSVTSIGNNVFRYCTSLTDIYATCGDFKRVKQLFNNDSRVKYKPLLYQITIMPTENGDVTYPVAADCDTILTAIPNYGYHFTQWSDGVTDNPRTIELTQDTTFTAEFAPNKYSISVTCDDTQGSIEGESGEFDYLTEKTYNAVPNYGYHFNHWQNTSSDIPDDALTVSQAIQLTLSLGENESTTQKYKVYGYITSNYASYYNSYYMSDTPGGESVFIIWRASNSAQIGDFVIADGYFTNYHNTPEMAQGGTITKLNTGYYDNPLTLAITQDINLEAIFAKNTYNITKNAEHGTISGNSSANYLDEVTLTVTPDYGYHFTQWSDGVKDNPRAFILTQDTAFTAEFAIDKSGRCGDELALTWTYDDNSKELTISSEGSLNSNYTFGVEAPTHVEKLVIAEGVTTIGNSAFAGYSTLKHISIPSSVKTIYEQAFYNCTGIQEIFSYRITPSTAYSNTFDGIEKFECVLHVLSASIDMYKAATGWRDFYYVQAIDAEEVTETLTTVSVTPSDNEVVVTWPTSENASAYILEITKDGVVFCTLVFNENGQLTGINFAPGRNGNARQVPTAIKTSNGGFRFTVTGLESSTDYHLTLNAKDFEEQVIATYTADFTTTGVATSIDQIDSSSLQGGDRGRLILRNGQILILRGDKTYTLQGQELR